MGEGEGGGGQDKDPLVPSPLHPLPPRGGEIFGRICLINYGLLSKSKIRRRMENQPIRLPGLKPGVCSGLILSGAFNPGFKIGVWRRRTYQFRNPQTEIRI